MRVTMPYSLTDKLVIGISSRALFDLEHENRLFDAQGVEAFSCVRRRMRTSRCAPAPPFRWSRRCWGSTRCCRSAASRWW